MNNEKFAPENPLNTPVLFLIFNRLDTTKQVFEAIREAKPPKLYVASDGPRENKAGEEETVIAIRKYVLKNIDWECDVKTLFRDKNLGCKDAVSGAINWFFENEEMGIILEDDCLPRQSFFWFCETMLNTYQNDTRIMMITGTNYLLNVKKYFKKDYFFSRYFSIWGWATWKRAWSMYDVKMSSWRNGIEPHDLRYISSNKYIIKHFEHTFDLIFKNKIDTWDIQWVYSGIFNYGLSVTPSINMISNIGVDGTHTTGTATDSNFLDTYDFKCISDIKINNEVYPEEDYDEKLHVSKSIPAVRLVIFTEILEKFHLLNFARFIKRRFLK